MAETKATLDQRLGLPNDVRQWITPPSLVPLILEAIDWVERTQDSHASGPNLPPGEARLLLTVLVYSYGVGLYASEEIAHELAIDPQLAYIAANSNLTEAQLRSFRRRHRGMLERTLTRLLRNLWTLQQPAGLEDKEGDELLFVWAAETRINRAVVADSMALDL